ncbi:chorismate lyase [Colwelliaceae bacterium MEBiC 14330]
MKSPASHFPVTLLGHWQAPSQQLLAPIASELRDWLLDQGSLTARLKRNSTLFRVELLGQAKQLCHETEANEFIKAGEPVLVREVLLYCDDIPQVFARTLIPLSSLTGEEKALANLGTQPLGQVLFNNPSLKREQLELSVFEQSSKVAQLALALGKAEDSNKSLVIDELWGRRSVFVVENKPLMVAEVFLPQAFAYQTY